MSTPRSCHCLVNTSLVITSPMAVKVKVGHTQKIVNNGKKSSEGEFLKKNVLITTGKGLKNLSKANAVKEKVIHSDQLEFLPLLRTFNSMLPAPNVTDHSYYDSVYLKISTALSLLAN